MLAGQIRQREGCRAQLAARSRREVRVWKSEPDAAVIPGRRAQAPRHESAEFAARVGQLAIAIWSGELQVKVVLAARLRTAPLAGLDVVQDDRDAPADVLIGERLVDEVVHDLHVGL